MTKRQLIEEIRQFNADASPRFLAQFDPDSLRQYLQHLKSAQRFPRRMMIRPDRSDQRMVC